MAVAGCGQVDDATCRAQATTSVPPTSDEMAQLDAIMAAVGSDPALAGNIWLLDADEATGTVTLALNDRSTDLCVRLRERYGPLLDILGPRSPDDSGGLFAG